MVAFGGIVLMVFKSEKTELGSNETLGAILIMIAALLSGATAI